MLEQDPPPHAPLLQPPQLHDGVGVFVGVGVGVLVACGRQEGSGEHHVSTPQPLGVQSLIICLSLLGQEPPPQAPGLATVQLHAGGSVGVGVKCWCRCESWSYYSVTSKPARITPTIPLRTIRV